MTRRRKKSTSVGVALNTPGLSDYRRALLAADRGAAATLKQAIATIEPDSSKLRDIGEAVLRYTKRDGKREAMMRAVVERWQPEDPALKDQLLHKAIVQGAGDVIADMTKAGYKLPEQKKVLEETLEAIAQHMGKGQHMEAGALCPDLFILENHRYFKIFSRQMFCPTNRQSPGALTYRYLDDLKRDSELLLPHADDARAIVCEAAAKGLSSLNQWWDFEAAIGINDQHSGVSTLILLEWLDPQTVREHATSQLEAGTRLSTAFFDKIYDKVQVQVVQGKLERDTAPAFGASRAPRL